MIKNIDDKETLNDLKTLNDLFKFSTNKIDDPYGKNNFKGWNKIGDWKIMDG